MTNDSLSMRSRAAGLTPARFGAALLVAGGVTLLGACSSGTGNAGAPATPATSSHPMTHSASPSVSVSVSAQTCKHVSSLRTSLESLTHLQLNAGASTQIRKDLTNIQTQIAAIKTSGNGALSTQVGAVASSVSQVEKAAKNLSSPPTAAQVQSIIAALGGVKSNSKATIDAMNAACPGS